MDDSLTYNEHRSSIIKNSWQRCKSEYGLDRANNENVVMLSGNELNDHREAAYEILSGSIKVIESVRHLAKEGDYCVLVADNNGVAIKGYADTPQSTECAGHGLLPGSLWDETLIGTNGIGTCLASKQSISISGTDHYADCLKSFTCSAAPIYAPDGSVLGAIDISRLSNKDYVESFFTFSFIREAAKQISANIFLEQFKGQSIIALSPTSIVTIYESKALMAVDDEGNIKGATQDCLQLLDQMDINQLIGRNCTDIFPITIDELYSAQMQPTHIKEGMFEDIFVKSIRKNSMSSAPIKKRLQLKRKTPSPQVKSKKLERFSGSDSKMRRLVKIGSQLIQKDISLLILGETGVGKDTYSKLLHEESTRAGKPYVAVNCAAIPESLMDSELFGYKPGTFTDGLKDGKKGKILASNGGTLFLDEIGDMPIALQAHLLRVLEEREVTPLGAVEPVPVDIRVICATHKNIFSLVEQGLFRQDLLYRIRGAQIELPPLRERTNIQEIVEEIITHQSDYDYNEIKLDDDVWNLFRTYSWPGNIRELRSALMYSLCLCSDQTIRLDDLPEELTQSMGSLSNLTISDSSGLRAENQLVSQSSSQSPHALASSSLVLPPVVRPETSLHHSNHLAEASHIEDLLKQNNWNVSASAQYLGISRSTLHRKIRKYNIIAPNKLS